MLDYQAVIISGEASITRIVLFIPVPKIAGESLVVNIFDKGRDNNIFERKVKTMKKIRPSKTFVVLVIAAFTAFFVVIGYHKYNRYTIDRKLTEGVLTNHRTTPHFRIYSNLDSQSVNYCEDFFEGFYGYFEKEYFRIGQKQPLKVYLFKDTGSFASYASTYRYAGPYGFYLGPRKNIIVANCDSGLGTTTHELVHHFIAVSFARRPAKWVEEGIAAFFEKFIGHFDGEGKLTISFGYFSNWRFPTTKRLIRFFNLNDIISSKEPDQCAARSLMLFLHKKGLFKSFVRKISVRTDDPTGSITLKEIYGKSIAEIEGEWKEWVRSQPIDENVNLVESAFVLTESEWNKWWEANKHRLYWDDSEQIYKVRNRTSNPAPEEE